MPPAATAPSTGTARLAARRESTSSKSGTRIVQPILQRAERAVAPVGGDETPSSVSAPTADAEPAGRAGR